MKRKAIMCMMAALCMGSSITAYAAPETMPDGTVFDAAYYAQNNPDVVAEMGTETDALYLHYVTFGKNEGRPAYDPSAQILTDNTSQPSAEQPKADQSKIVGIQGAAGVKYELPTWGTGDSYDGSPVDDKMINMTVQTTSDLEFVNETLPYLAPYTTEGYEWRFLQYIISGVKETNYSLLANSYWSCRVDNSKDWNETGDYDGYTDKFTVTQNGIDYTECKLYHTLGGYIGDVNMLEGVYVLLPKGFTGNVYYTVKGALMGENGMTYNNDAAVTFLF